MQFILFNVKLVFLWKTSSSFYRWFFSFYKKTEKQRKNKYKQSKYSERKTKWREERKREVKKDRHKTSLDRFQDCSTALFLITINQWMFPLTMNECSLYQWMNVLFINEWMNDPFSGEWMSSLCLCRSTTISVAELQGVSQGNSDSGSEWLRLPTASLTIVFYLMIPMEAWLEQWVGVKEPTLGMKFDLCDNENCFLYALLSIIKHTWMFFLYMHMWCVDWQ